MEKNILVGFTINEAQVMLEIIDIAVRARGVAAAEAGLVLTKKIENKLKEILPAATPAQAPAPAQASVAENLFAPHIIKP
jgi:hypothetical protein